MTFTRFIEAVGITALAACLLLGAQAPASARSSQNNKDFCDGLWNKSTAANYCANAIVSWYQEKGRIQCGVRVTCTVDVQVGGVDRRISQEVESLAGDTSSLTLCFSRVARTHEDGNVVWKISMHPRCGINKIDVTTAVQNGLPAQ